MTQFGSKVTGASGRGYSAEITVTGLSETLVALKEFEPDLYKDLMAQIRAGLRAVKAGALGRHPAGAYALRTRIKSGRTTLVGGTVVAISGGGAGNDWSDGGRRGVIFEFAKTASGAQPQNVARTQHMLDTISGRFGSPGRFLWASWDSVGTGVRAGIVTAVKFAEAELQRRLNAAGVSY